MYYLDLYKIYTPTVKEERIKVRSTLHRDSVMATRLKQQHYQCFFCAVEITMDDHLDHLTPVYYGGTNQLRNLAAACKSCNMTKLVDQIEITNPYTIARYKSLIEARKKWKAKIKLKPWLIKYPPPKKAQLYTVYRADLFREIP